MTPQSPQDGSGGAQVGSAVHGEGSERQAGAQGVTEEDRRRALGVVIEWERGGLQGVLMENIAAALAEERAKARAPFLVGVEQIREIAREAAKLPGCEEFAVRVAMVTKDLPR